MSGLSGPSLFIYSLYDIEMKDTSINFVTPFIFKHFTFMYKFNKTQLSSVTVQSELFSNTYDSIHMKKCRIWNKRKNTHKSMCFRCALCHVTQKTAEGWRQQRRDKTLLSLLFGSQSCGSSWTSVPWKQCNFIDTSFLPSPSSHHQTNTLAGFLLPWHDSITCKLKAHSFSHSGTHGT
jgi:hypothetical protein